MLKEINKNWKLLNNWLKGLVNVAEVQRNALSEAFTLPEVIISFSVLIMVITSATGILVSVIRSNNDNVNSLVANGLAQEGIEAIRFVRDSDAVLGLGFDGAKNTNVIDLIWGGKLFEGNSSVLNYAIDLVSVDSNLSCPKNDLGSCLPLKLRKIEVDSGLEKSPETMVYRKADEVDSAVKVKTVNNYYYQKAMPDVTDVASPYHRYIRIATGKCDGVSNTSALLAVKPNTLCVSSFVSWVASNDLARSVVLTTELTNWK